MPSAPQPTRIKPPALRSGDRVGVVAPASNIKRELLEQGCERLRQLGYDPFYFESILDRDLYFAGSVERRARELRAILCARGGYGSNYLPLELDPKKIVSHPKILVGYSDITTLVCCMADSANFVTFHGPMVTKDFTLDDGVDMASWTAAVGGVPEWEIGTGSGARALAPGEGHGVLYGGCLSMLVASIGTKHEIRTDGTILFIEDVATKPFQIDRMLMQLKLAGKLAGVRGIIFGEMLDCRQSADQDYTLEEVVMRILGDLKIPVAFGMRSGHVSRANITVPIGVRARLVVGDDVVLKILEAATAKR